MLAELGPGPGGFLEAPGPAVKNPGAMRTRCVLLLLLLVLALPALPGHTAGPLAIFGVQPGMASEEVRKLLGTPEVEKKTPPTWCYRRGVRGQDDPSVLLDGSGRVRFVAGSRLERDGQALLARGATLPEIEAALGKPSGTRAGQGPTRLVVYGPLQLTVVMAGEPGRAMVFGLGEEPR